MFQCMHLRILSECLYAFDKLPNANNNINIVDHDDHDDGATNNNPAMLGSEHMSAMQQRLSDEHLRRWCLWMRS